MTQIAFGPVPSRRLGKSIGINNIPPKVCSYACIYCQLGRAIEMEYRRKEFYSPEEVVEQVTQQVRKAEESGDIPDYLTFVPDGESTLDIHLGAEISELKKLGYKLAIITNSSLMNREDVQNELLNLDLVSVKVDTAEEETWRKINHPHKQLSFNDMKEGLHQFSKKYKGKLITETMLIDGVNDSKEQLEKTAAFIASLKPSVAYISIPTRPPARKNVKAATEEAINMAYQIFSSQIKHVEMITGHEGNAFAHTGDTAQDILSITAVHPMREDSVKEFLEKDGKSWDIIEQLLKEEKLLETEFSGHKFYVRKLADHQQI